MRADAVQASTERMHAADIEMILRKKSLFVWLVDPKTCNFVTSTSPHAQPREDMWRLKIAEGEQNSQKQKQGAQKAQQLMQVNVHSGT